MVKSIKKRCALLFGFIGACACVLAAENLTHRVRTAEATEYVTIQADYDNTVANLYGVEINEGESAVLDMQIKDVLMMPESVGFSVYSGYGEDKISFMTDGESVSVENVEGALDDVAIVKSLAPLEEIINPKFDLKASFSLENGEYYFRLLRKNRNYMKDYTTVWEMELSYMPTSDVYFAFETKGESEIVFYDLAFYKTQASTELAYEIVGYDYTEYDILNENEFILTSEKENALISEYSYDITDKVVEISFKIIEAEISSFAGFVLSEEGGYSSYKGANDIFVKYTANGTEVLVGEQAISVLGDLSIKATDIFVAGNTLLARFDVKNGAFVLLKNGQEIQTITGIDYLLDKAQACFQFGDATKLRAKNLKMQYIVSQEETRKEFVGAEYQYIQPERALARINIKNVQKGGAYVTTKEYVDLTKENSSIVMEFDLVDTYQSGSAMGVSVHWGQATAGVNFMYSDADIRGLLSNGIDFKLASGYSYRITLSKAVVVGERKSIGASTWSIVATASLENKTTWDWTKIRLGMQQGNGAIFNFENFAIALNGELSELEISPKYKQTATIEEVVPPITHDNSLKNVAMLTLSAESVNGVIANKEPFDLSGEKSVHLETLLKGIDFEKSSIAVRDSGNQIVYEWKAPSEWSINNVSNFAVVLSTSGMQISCGSLWTDTVVFDFSTVKYLQLKCSDTNIQIENFVIKEVGGQEEFFDLFVSDDILAKCQATIYTVIKSDEYIYSPNITEFAYEGKKVIQSVGDGYVATESIVVDDNSIYFEIAVDEYSLYSDISVSNTNFATGFSFGSSIGLQTSSDLLHASYGGFAISYRNFYTATSPDSYTSVECDKKSYPSVYISNDIKRDEIFVLGNTVLAVYSPKQGKYSLLIKKQGETQYTLVQEIIGLHYTESNVYVALHTQKGMTLKSSGMRYWVGSGMTAIAKTNAIVLGEERKGDGSNPDSIVSVFNPNTKVEGKGAEHAYLLDSKNYEFSYFISEELESFEKYQSISFDFEVDYYKQNSKSFSDLTSISLVNMVTQYDVYTTTTALSSGYITSNETLPLTGDNYISMEIDVISSFSPGDAVWCAFALGKDKALSGNYLYENETASLMYGKKIGYMEKGYTVKAVATKDYVKIFRKRIMETVYPEEALYTFLPADKNNQANFSAYARLGFQFATPGISASYANLKITMFDATANITTSATIYFSPKVMENTATSRLSREFYVGYKSENTLAEGTYGNASYKGCDVLASGAYVLEQSFAMQEHFLRDGVCVNMQISKNDDTHDFDYYDLYTKEIGEQDFSRLQTIQVLDFSREDVCISFSAEGVLRLKNIFCKAGSRSTESLEYMASSGAIIDSEIANKLIQLDIVNMYEDRGIVRGAGNYYIGDQVELIAEEEEGYLFEGWYILPSGVSPTEGNISRYRISEEAQYSVDLTVELCKYLDVVIYANFEPAVKLVLIVGENIEEISVIAGREYTVYPKYTANNTFVGWKVDGTLIDEKNLNADGSYTFTMTSKELTVEAVIEEGNQTSSSVIVQNKNENQTLENIKIAVLISSVLIVSLATGFIIFNKKRKGK